MTPEFAEFGDFSSAPRCLLLRHDQRVIRLAPTRLRTHDGHGCVVGGLGRLRAADAKPRSSTTSKLCVPMLGHQQTAGCGFGRPALAVHEESDRWRSGFSAKILKRLSLVRARHPTADEVLTDHLPTPAIALAQKHRHGGLITRSHGLRHPQRCADLRWEESAGCLPRSSGAAPLRRPVLLRRTVRLLPASTGDDHRRHLLLMKATHGRGERDLNLFSFRARADFEKS